MRLNRIFHIFIIFLIAFVFMGANPSSKAGTKKVVSPQQLLSKADQSMNALLASTKQMNQRHNWLNCISKYQDIYDKYPKSDQAPWALFHAGTLYRKMYKYSGLDDDPEKAIGLFEKLIDGYKDHQLADDAQYQKGEIFYREKNDPTRAYVEFLKIDVNFPSGDMKSRAKVIMDEISVKLGKKEEAKQEAAAEPASGAATVKNIRSWATPTYTRVVIDTDTPVKYTSDLVKEDVIPGKPRRLYVDLENCHMSPETVPNIPIKDGLLKAASAEQRSQDSVRVALDIGSVGEYKIFSLYDPFRIVIDVQGTGGEDKEVKKDSTITSTPVTRTARRGIFKPEGADPEVSLARQLGLNVKRIVIDPGHGGKDPGTQISGDIQEKDITLDIAKRLAASLEKSIGCEVLLTRDKDVFIPLDERTAFANINKADLFISIHVNAHKRSSVYGLETYFLNMATDESAVIVAARENATSEKNISDLQSILNDLMLNTKISESSKLAYKVQDGMMVKVKKTYKVNKSLGVKQAPFYVLIGAEMPAVLIETGFITNPTEKKRLLNDNYKNILVDGIARGVNSYIKGIEQAYNTVK
jgi:N-acetylmuramoyl-L-alanine amidase